MMRLSFGFPFKAFARMAGIFGCVLLLHVLCAPRAGASEQLGEKGSSQRPHWARAIAAAVMYLPNRVLDLGDVIRFGVNLGPGLGVDAQATQALRAAWIADTSVGVGFETFRHLPFCIRSHVKAAVGPVATPNLSGLNWPNRDWDTGLELYLAIVGAHLYVNPSSILDFFAGIILLDPEKDDFGI